MMPILIGMFSGIFSGIGMGGGTILIFLLTTFLNIEQHLAQSTNLIYFIPTAITAIFVNYKNKKLTVGNGIIFGKILSYDMYSLWGYESIKDLYNDIDVDDEKIDASEGLYVD